MQLIVVLCLIVKLALVSGDCDVGKTVKDFDFTKFTGTWYIMYHLSNEHDDDISCVTMHVDEPVGNVSAILTYEYDKSKRIQALRAGFHKDWDNTGFTVTYAHDSTWDGRSYVVAIDYKRYAIFKFCTKNFDKLINYVGFRSAHPEEDTLKEVQKALQDNNIDIKQLVSWDDDRCPKL